MDTANNSSQGLRVAVIGGGWAGMAAAVYATQAGHAVTLFEAAHQWGGRARTVTLPWPDGRGGTAPLDLDNGQHILIGAYSATWALMRLLGADPSRDFLRLPLTLRFADGTGLALPDWHAPALTHARGLDAAWGIATARGWRWADRLALLRASRRWQAMGFACLPDWSVARLCEGLSPRLMAEFIEPLCVSALNTPAAEASGQIFLRVLRDSLMGERVGRLGPSNLMLPRKPLGALWCDTAAAWLAERGADLRLGQPVTRLRPWHAGWHVDGEPFDAVILATSAAPAARLVQTPDVPGAASWHVLASALRFEAIATVYAEVCVDQPTVDGGYHLNFPMLALRPTARHPAQFVFERDRLQGTPGATRALAFVISASRLGRDAIAQGVVDQARAELNLAVQPRHVLIDKRATFCCTPGLRRPPMAIAPGLLACGDYVDGPYPATLEGALRSAQDAVAALAGS